MLRLLRKALEAVLYCSHCRANTNHTFMSGHYFCDDCGTQYRQW